MFRRQVDMWDWGTGERMEIKTGSHQQIDDDWRHGLDTIPQREDLAQTGAPASGGCAEKEQPGYSENGRKNSKVQCWGGQRNMSALSGVASTFEKSRGKLWEASIRVSNKAILASAGLWSGESNSKTEVSWGEEMETLKIQNSIKELGCEEDNVDREVASEDYRVFANCCILMGEIRVCSERW